MYLFFQCVSEAVVEKGLRGQLQDAIDLKKNAQLEQEFLQYVETSNPSILKNIAEKKALDDGIKAEIKKAVESFKERFGASVAAGAK